MRSGRCILYDVSMETERSLGSFTHSIKMVGTAHCAPFGLATDHEGYRPHGSRYTQGQKPATSTDPAVHIDQSTICTTQAPMATMDDTRIQTGFNRFVQRQMYSPAETMRYRNGTTHQKSTSWLHPTISYFHWTTHQERGIGGSQRTLEPARHVSQGNRAPGDRRRRGTDLTWLH